MRLLLAAFIWALVLVSTPAFARDEDSPLGGFYIGPIGGHMQTAATVRLPRDANGNPTGQINDTGGNTFVAGLIGGWSGGSPDGLFYALEARVLFPMEPYPTTIVQFGGLDYVVKNGVQGGLHARIGLQVRNDAAIYGILGVALGQVDYVLSGQSNPRVLWYPQVGGGAEVYLGDGMSVRGDLTFDRIALDLGPLDVRYQVRWTITAAVIYRF